MNAGFQVGGLIVLTAVFIAVAVWVVKRVHGTPDQRERKRRLLIHKTGRLGDAQITEVAENTLYFSYLVRGVQYTTSQDVSAVRDHLPTNLDHLIGPAGLKYLVNNPANSILVCEEWNGCRLTSAAPSGSPLLDPDAVGH